MNNTGIYLFLKTVVISSLLFLQACNSLPQSYESQQQLTPEDRLKFNLVVYDKAWDLVNRKYHDPEFNGADWNALRDHYREEAASATDNDTLYSVINQLLGNIGESHLYARGLENPDITTSNAGTFGFSFKAVEGQPVVAEVFPGSPAEEHGIEAGWLINSYNDKLYPTTHDVFPVNTVTNYTVSTGDAGTFTFTDIENNQHHAVLIAAVDTSQSTKSVSPQLKSLGDGYFYQAIPAFMEPYIPDLKDTLKYNLDARGIIIDLRDNPGGIVAYELRAIGYFFSEHPVNAGYEVNRRKGKERLKTPLPWGSLKFPGQVVVLINNRSGSAAEIFARVLQHYGRGTIVGQQSSGSVLTSRYFYLPDGGRITIPVRDYLGPDRERIEGNGVTPDIEVPLPTIDDLRKNPERDLELETAIKVLKGEIT